MQYIIPVATSSSAFDEVQMGTVLLVQKELQYADFICMSGWQPQPTAPQVWREQRKWLLENGIPLKNISCPEAMSWPGSMGVEIVGQALSLFDQINCVASLTTDDFWSKGELFFVGPSYLKQLTLELARFHQIPRCPVAERIEYRVSGAGDEQLTDQFKDTIRRCLLVLSDRKAPGFDWMPRTFKQQRQKKYTWLKKHCV